MICTENDSSHTQFILLQHVAFIQNEGFVVEVVTEHRIIILLLVEHMIKTEKLLIYCFYWWFLTLTWKHFIFYCSALVKTELLLFFNTILTNLLFEARYLLPFQSWAKNSVFKLFLFICLSKSLFSFKHGCTTIFSECVFTQISQMSDKIDIG